MTYKIELSTGKTVTVLPLYIMYNWNPIVFPPDGLTEEENIEASERVIEDLAVFAAEKSLNRC